MDINDIISALKHTIEYQENMRSILGKESHYRCIVFPQEISEHFIIYILRNINKIDARWCKDRGAPISGDGYIPDNDFIVKLKYIKSNVKLSIEYTGLKKLEFKFFTSNGPCSFGPKEKWDTIYFLDGLNYQDYKFKLYEIPLSNVSEEWKNLKVNKTETFADQASVGRRPRIKFDSIMSQLSNNCQLIWEGDIREFIKD
tara:strand:+ start:573 stop:1172 length:600 start_codon:yes stop_codon:yes gene_type:complete